MEEVEIELIASRIRNDMRKRIEFCDNVGITLDDYYIKQCGDFEIEDMVRAFENGKVIDEEENNKLLDVINNQDVKIADLENQIKQIEKVSDYNADQLAQAKEHIRTLISCLIDWVQEGDKDYCHIADAEQFLKEIEK